jgi:hypothetical protein
VTLVPEPGAVVARLLETAARAIRAPVAGPGSMGGGVGGAGFRIVGIGWATVELDRASAELGASLHQPADAWTPADRDQLLGAAAMLGPRLGLDAHGPRLVLLEPDTEGRLAASLARHGEGVAAVYVVDTLAERVAQTHRPAGDSPPGPARSAIAAGPLGGARLVLGGPISGPHVIVLDEAMNPESLPSAGD